MKISVVCAGAFLLCILYWVFETSSSVVQAETAGALEPIDESLYSSTNITETFESESDDNNSGEDLEISDRLHSSFVDIVKEKTEEQNRENYAFIETLSQASSVQHDATNTESEIVHTVVDSTTLDVQEKVEELTISSAATIASHHNETPTLVKNNLSTEKASIINSLNDNVSEENLALNFKMQHRSEEINVSKDVEQTDQVKIEVPIIEPKNNVTDQQPQTREEIPSFSEWTQKQLEEAEKKKEEVNSSSHNQHTNNKPTSIHKKRWKNYASPDCGSKIIAANPEAVSASSVLAPSRDEYKLNACTSRIWFIVELCEAIQAKKIDLANFELFSSSPKEFSISVSDRFPTRDWSSVGHFTAKDERDIQSFDLHPHLFGKYIKFEMHSHHGSEHYCPISLFRVYGTSEFEVLETENQVHANIADDDDDEETLDFENGEAPKNLFSSATDAVISIVKKAAEVLGNKGNVSTTIKDQQNVTIINYTPLISTCTTPSHIVVCDNCSDLLFGKVFELLSCNSKELTQLVEKPFIKETLYSSDVCSKFGLEFRSKSTSSAHCQYKSYIDSFFPLKLIAALCNTIAVNECKVVLNISANATSITQNLNEIPMHTKILNVPTSDQNLSGYVKETQKSDFNAEQNDSVIIEKDFSTHSYTSQIKPTKTLTSEDLNLTNTPINVEKIDYAEGVHATDSLNLPNRQIENSTNEDKSTTQQMEPIVMSSEIVSDLDTTESSETLDEHLDNLVTELNGESSSNIATTTITPPALPQAQKESVFLRLSNRIKALERNMSLSSQYLEELSQRYKKQVEEMQRLLDKTINTLSEENKRKEDRTEKLEEQIILLRESVNGLIVEKNSWITTTYWLLLTGIIVIGFLLFCRRNQEHKQPKLEERTNNSEIQRRKSVDVITHKTPVAKKRRPSEEASMMINGTYSNLMINETDTNSVKLKDRKRRKKKQGNQQPKSNSITTLNEEVTDNEDRSCRTVNSDKGSYTTTNVSNIFWQRQDSAPPILHCEWIDENLGGDRIQDIPFVLEDSEHTSLEHLTFSSNRKHSGKENGNAIPPLNTATDARAQRLLLKQRSGSSLNKVGHKKSASFDDTKIKSASPIATDASLNNSLDDTGKLTSLKKEKKNSFKKFFKSFSFK